MSAPRRGRVLRGPHRDQPPFQHQRLAFPLRRARLAAAHWWPAQSGKHRGPGLQPHCAQALRPPSIDRLLGRENCVSLGASNRAFQWFGRCVNYPSPLASANGNFDLVPDAAVLHELGAPLGSISPCAVPIAQAVWWSAATSLLRTGDSQRHGMAREQRRSRPVHGSTHRFRTIQARPKDWLTLPPTG